MDKKTRDEMISHRKIIHRKTIDLPDGFNGATMAFYVEPIETDGELVKLQCAEPHKGFLFRWARMSDLKR